MHRRAQLRHLHPRALKEKITLIPRWIRRAQGATNLSRPSATNGETERSDRPNQPESGEDEEELGLCGYFAAYQGSAGAFPCA